MRRSRQVKVTIIATLGITLGPLVASCGGKDNPPSQALHCVDENNVVVEERVCEEQDQNRAGGGGILPFFWWYGGGLGGSRLAPGTTMSGGSRVPVDGASYKTAGGIERAGFGGGSRSISNSGGTKGTGAGG